MAVNASGAKTKTLSDLRRYQTRAGERKKKENLRFTPLLTVQVRHDSTLRWGLQVQYFSNFDKVPNVPALHTNAACSLWYPYPAAIRRYILHHAFLPLAPQSASFPGNAPWVHYSPRYLIMSLSLSHNPPSSAKKGMMASYLQSKSPIPFPIKARYHGIVSEAHHTHPDSFSRSSSPDQKKKKSLSKNSTKNSFILHAQLHCLHTARRRASFLSCPGLALPSSASTIFESSHQAHSSTSMTFFNSQRRKKLVKFSVRAWHGIVGVKRLDLTRGDLFSKPDPRRTPQRHRLCLIRLRGSYRRASQARPDLGSG
jgi:hypothetical protein